MPTLSNKRMKQSQNTGRTEDPCTRRSTQDTRTASTATTGELVNCRRRRRTVDGRWRQRGAGSGGERSEFLMILRSFLSHSPSLSSYSFTASCDPSVGFVHSADHHRETREHQSFVLLCETVLTCRQDHRSTSTIIHYCIDYRKPSTMSNGGWRMDP